MRTICCLLLLVVCLPGCGQKGAGDLPGSRGARGKAPGTVDFVNMTIPTDKLIHKGVFGPDMRAYYYTVSDTAYHHFDVYQIEKLDRGWSVAQPAFFNSDYNEHGMSFSPDGKHLYFSSTRPTQQEGVVDTWHLWRSELVDGTWQAPEFIDIPNLRDMLVSHPSISADGTLYFHVAQPDYSGMRLYQSRELDRRFAEAVPVEFPEGFTLAACTPFVSPKGDYLFFASIGVQLRLMISHRDGRGKWAMPRPLGDQINQQGQGNPSVTADSKWLLYTTGSHDGSNWQVNKVALDTALMAIMGDFSMEAFAERLD